MRKELAALKANAAKGQKIASNFVLAFLDFFCNFAIESAILTNHFGSCV